VTSTSDRDPEQPQLYESASVSEPKDRRGDSVRRRDPAATVRRILDVAVTRFDSDGPDGIVVTRIAAEAGVSVGAIYHHFSGRSSLIAAARAEQFRRTTDRDVAEILQAVRTAESFRDFEEFNRLLVRRNRAPERMTARQQRVAALAAATDDAETALELLEAQRTLTDGLVAAIDEARRQGWFDPDVDARAWAVLVQGLFLGAVLADLDDRLDDDRWVELVERVQALAIRPSTGDASGA